MISVFLFSSSSFRTRKLHRVNQLLKRVFFFFVFQNSDSLIFQILTPKKPVLRCVVQSKSRLIVELFESRGRSWPHRTRESVIVASPAESRRPRRRALSDTHKHTNTAKQKELLVREQNYCEFLGWDTSINYPKLISCSIFTHYEIVHFVSRAHARTFLVRERKVQFPKKFVFWYRCEKKHKHKFAFSLLCIVNPIPTTQ